jgi:hypothetical protein
MLKISFEIVKDIKVEATTWMDWFSLFVLSVVTIWMSCTLILVHYYKKRYPPLSAKDPTNVSIVILSSMIHLWAIIVAEDSIENARDTRSVSCPLWSFTLQYTLGLNVWLVSLAYRMMKYISIFVTHSRVSYKPRSSRIRYATCALYFLPLLVLDLLVRTQNGCTFSESTGACATGTVWKVCLVSLIVAWEMLLCYMTYVVRRTVIHEFMNESRQLTKVTVASVCVIVVNGTINFAGWTVTSLGRSTFLLVFATFHLYSQATLFYGPLWKAMRKNRSYAVMFDKSIQPLQSVTMVRTMEDIVSNKKTLYEFLSYCNGETSNIESEDRYVVEFANVVRSFNHSFDSSSYLNNNKQATLIESTYISSRGMKYIGVNCPSLPMNNGPVEKGMFDTLVTDAITDKLRKYMNKFVDDRMLRSPLHTGNGYGLKTALLEENLLNTNSAHTEDKTAYMFTDSNDRYPSDDEDM